MSRSFLLSDPFYSGSFPLLPQQSICAIDSGVRSSNEAKFIRLLAGTLTISDRGGSQVCNQKRNFLVLGAPQRTIRSTAGLRLMLKALGLDWRQVDRHLARSLSHQDFFKHALAELTEFFVRSEVGSHTLAFLHAYRLMERIAFVFPFLYASRSGNYVSVFSTLRDYFKGDKESEIGFFKTMQSRAIDQASREAPVKFDFSSLGLLGGKCCAVIVRSIDPAAISSGGTGLNHVEFKAEQLMPMLINLRNRYFHYSVSNPSNIAVEEIGDSDQFFGVVNSSIMNWIGVVFLAVLQERLK